MRHTSRLTLVVAILAAMVIFTSGCARANEASPSLSDANWPYPYQTVETHPGAKAAPASSPETYPHDKAFFQRARLVVEGLGDEDLGKWRRGWFARGGDPAKYLIGAAMARLIRDPNDAMARKYMNDERTYKEHYHFGTVNWARFYPIFAEKVLTEEIRKKFAEKGFRYGSYTSPRGTENHKVMWWTSANVLPYYTGKGLSHRSVEATLKRAKQQLRSYVKGLYQAGQGEWDSSTYLMFDVNGMLNIYDFSKDPEARLLAKAALDWYITGYALKYTDGIYCAPNQRGYASGPVEKIADRTGYVWWGTRKKMTADALGDARYTLHAITSAYRPNKVITNIATKNLPKLPVEQRNTKPNYWHGLSLKPTPGVYHESVYLSRHYTMGSLWNGTGGQMSRFQIVASTPDGGVPFTGGHPTGYKYKDGGGKYDQTAHVGAVHVLLSRIAKDDPAGYVFFSLPNGAGKPTRHGDWYLITADKTYLALLPLSEKTEVGETELTNKQKQRNAKAAEQGKDPRYTPKPILKLHGPATGWVLVTGDASTYDSLDAFKASLGKRKVDVSGWPKKGRVSFVTPDGRQTRVSYQQGKDRPAVVVNGKTVDYDKWDAVYAGPYVKQDNGVLTVTDGKDGFIVDFTGEKPVYKPWKK